MRLILLLHTLRDYKISIIYFIHSGDSIISYGRKSGLMTSEPRLRMVHDPSSIQRVLQGTKGWGLEMRIPVSLHYFQLWPARYGIKATKAS